MIDSTFADFQGLAKDDGFSFNFIMVHSHCVYDIHSLGQLSHHIDRMPVGKLVLSKMSFKRWVALERSVERANHACEHDKFARQQIPILEVIHSTLDIMVVVYV